MNKALNQVWRAVVYLGTLVSAVYVAGAGDKML
jgi:hypothetical protein